jgi:hypothetical protein
MTEPDEHLVIPYSRFLEWQERRRPIHEPPRPEPPTTGADVPPAPADPHAPIATAWRSS